MAADRNLILQLLITAQNQASQELEQLRERLNDVGDGADSAGQRTRILQDALGELVTKVGAAVAFGALAQQFVEANREADKLAKQFRAMTGDTEAAAHEIEFLRTVADRWGTTVGDIAPAYLRLAAAVKGTTAEGEPARKMIDDLTAAYINAGQSVEDMEEVMEIMGEAFAEGRVSIDDLREGMQEDMPPAIQAATTAILENNAALQKMLESGDAATDEFMPAFAAALREHIGGSATTIDTVDAAFSRLTARTKDLFVKIDDVIPLMSLYDGTLKSVASAGTAVVNVVDLLVDGLALVGNTVGAAAGALVTGGDALEAVGEQARLSGESMAATVTHMAGLKTATEEAAERQKQMQAELQAVADAADPYAAALRTVTQDLADAQTAFEQTGDAAALTATALETFLKIPEKRINSEGVLALAAALKVVGDQAEDSSQTISNTLGQELAKLTDDQLTRLEAQARDALAAASDGSEEGRKAFSELGQIIEGVVLARLARLGVDGPEALTGISTAANAVIHDFEAVAQSGVLSADGIKAAFDGALAHLDNPKELDQFRKRIIALGESGVLTGEQVSTGLYAVQRQLESIANEPALAELTKAQEAARQSALNLIRAEIDLARAKGDTAEVTRLQTILADKEVQQAQAVADEKQREADSLQQQLINRLKYRASLQESNAELEREIQLLIARTLAAQGEAAAAQKQAETKRVTTDATDQNTDATERNTSAIEENTEAAEANAEANAEAGRSYQLMENAAVGALRELSGLSAGMEELISQLLHVDGVGRMFGHEFRGELGKLQLQLNQTNQALEHNAKIISPLVGLGFEKTADAANTARKMYLEQAIAATELAGRLQDVTNSADGNQRALQDLVNNAQRSITAMRLLDQETLDRLQDAIDSANDKLRVMQAETQSARDSLAEMNAELLEAQGLDAKAELLRQQLDYQKKLADIEAQRQDAELSGNRELITILNEQRKVLEQINRTKVANIEADAAEQAQSRSNTTTPTNTGNVTPINRAGGGKTYNLNLVGVRGQTLNATTDTDPSAFLTALEDAQRRGMIQ